MNTDLIIAMYESAKLNGELERFYKLHKQRRRGLITDFAYIVQFYDLDIQHVEDEEELAFDEHFESSATDMVSVTHYPCMECSNKHMDAIEFGEEFELCDGCKLVETEWEPIDISDEDWPF